MAVLPTALNPAASLNDIDAGFKASCFSWSETYWASAPCPLAL